MVAATLAVNLDISLVLALTPVVYNNLDLVAVLVVLVGVMAVDSVADLVAVLDLQLATSAVVQTTTLAIARPRL